MKRAKSERADPPRPRTPKSKDISINRPVSEQSLQFVGQPTSGQLDAVLGIDFGTSSTRAVVRLPFYTQTPTFAIPIGHGIRDLEQYLLPTKLFVDKQGFCSLMFDVGASMFVELKANLMARPHTHMQAVFGPPCAIPTTVVATAYLALVLRQARTWFISEKGREYGRFTLDWMVNFGLPAAIDNSSKRRRSFESVIRAAWIASIRSGPISINHCERLVAEVEPEIDDSGGAKVDIELVPEVVAQALGYAKSQFRNEGLHLLIDVGASTLDVCSFNLFSNEHEYQWPILTADVKPLGARQLHYVRLQAAQDPVNKRILSQFDVADPLAVVPSPVVDEKCIGDAEDFFTQRCRSVIGSAIFDLKEHRYPNAPAWSGSLPVIICGGAAVLGVYQQAFSNISRWMQRSYRSSNGLRAVRLPKPKGLESNLRDDHYHRISVAYGLSYPTFDMGKYKRPKEIEDIGNGSGPDGSGLGASGLRSRDKEIT